MTKLKWNAVGERFYETGLDRAVLFVDGQLPVSWNGLLSVASKPTGGEFEPIYLDGTKYLENTTRQEYNGVIKAMYYPVEFNRCNGLRSVQHYGLLATKQNRSNFNLTYRTKVGNDVSGTDNGYKIHLIYNATVSSSSVEYSTLSNITKATITSWNITAVPPRTPGYSATAHRVVDSRDYDAAIITDLETILYGTENVDPRFPHHNELTALLLGGTWSGS